MKGVTARGACPSLSAPMATGDGLLVRLNPRHGSLRPRQLSGIAEAAGRHGNGLIEITARGSLQMRGLTDDTAQPFADAVAALGIEADSGVEVRIGPLAGHDAAELTDPRPLADAVSEAIATRGLAGRLAPKVSVIVDGGGALGLSSVTADVRLEAVDEGDQFSWRVGVGGHSGTATILGAGDRNAAAKAAIETLAALAETGPAARGRVLGKETLARLTAGLAHANRPSAAPAAKPVGVFALRGGLAAGGLALPFGQIGFEELAAFAGVVDPVRELRLAPGRGLLVLGLDPDERARLFAVAERLGFVTRPDDPRLRVAACAGAPACVSAYLPTKAIARAVVAEHSCLPDDVPTLHISGCAKQCARPAGPSLTVIGSEAGYEIFADGLETDSATRRAVARVADAHAPKRRRSA